MNNAFFVNGFLTSTEAQNICNVARESLSNLHEQLKNVAFYDTTISSIMNSGAAVQSQAGVKDWKWIPEALAKIGNYNALIAWLNEAIKEKDEEIQRVGTLSATEYPNYICYTMPRQPVQVAPVCEKDVLSEMDNLNEYLALQSKAAAIGVYIHDDGSVAKARKALISKLANPAAVSGTGRDTVIYTYTPSVKALQIEDMYMKLLAEHRALNSKLNHMKAKIKEEVNNRNIKQEQEYRKEYSKYEQELSEYYNAVNKQESAIAEFRISERERVSKLKIGVPQSLMATYKEVKALISEKD